MLHIPQNDLRIEFRCTFCCNFVIESWAPRHRKGFNNTHNEILQLRMTRVRMKSFALYVAILDVMLKRSSVSLPLFRREYKGWILCLHTAELTVEAN